MIHIFLSIYFLAPEIATHPDIAARIAALSDGVPEQRPTCPEGAPGSLELPQYYNDGTMFQTGPSTHNVWGFAAGNASCPVEVREKCRNGYGNSLVFFILGTYICKDYISFHPEQHSTTLGLARLYICYFFRLASNFVELIVIIFLVAILMSSARLEWLYDLSKFFSFPLQNAFLISVAFNSTSKFVWSESERLYIWEVEMPPVSENGLQCSLTISIGRLEKSLQIIFGDIWLCLGQSNMAMSMAQLKNSEAEVKEGNRKRKCRDQLMTYFKRFIFWRGIFSMY